MLTICIIDASAKRRNELALALQSLGGFQTIVYATSEALNLETLNADAVIAPVEQPLSIQTDLPIILFGETKPVRLTDYPFVSLYPLPACIEAIRNHIFTGNPNDK